MESPLDFQPDFDKTSRPPMTETPNNEAPKEDVPYIETEHKGNKVYVCTFPNCSKAFKYQSQANRHSIVHKKDRPFPCTYKGCNKSFKRADILETHMQLHTENLPFACDQPGCDRRFASKPALKYHQVKHVNNRGFKCYVEDCGKSFLVASQLKQHMKAMHPDAVPPPESTTEEERPIDPETEKEFQQFLAAPYSRSEWQLMTLSCQEQQTEETQEYFRVFFNYIINQLRVLKEQVRIEPESQRPTQVNTDNFNFGSTLQNSFSEFAKLTEHFDSDEFKFLDFLRESADNTS